MRYPNQNQIFWQFDTANFRLVFHVEDCDLDPKDCFQFKSDVKMVRENRCTWFDAFVSVWRGNDEDSLEYLAHDHLGACAYASVLEFYTAHRCRDPMNRNCSVMRAKRGDNVVICHYFPDMVATAISEARDAIAKKATLAA
jgi:hypothetical protein